MSSTRRVAMLAAAVRGAGGSRGRAANVARPRRRDADHDRLGVRHRQGAMAPFDGPALAAAQVRVKQINAKGGVYGRPLKIITCDTQGNKPDAREGVRARAARPEPAGHLHDLRRRLRDAGRPGVDQQGPAHDRAVHRHRPDGAQALRRAGQAGVQLRERRAGRGVGDGRSTRCRRAGRRPRSARTRCSSTSRTSSTRSQALHAARRQGRRAGDVRELRRQQRQHRRQPRRTRRRPTCTSPATAFDGAAGVRRRAPHARQQHADPQLVGRRRHVLVRRRARR